MSLVQYQIKTEPVMHYQTEAAPVFVEPDVPFNLKWPHRISIVPVMHYQTEAAPVFVEPDVPLNPKWTLILELDPTWIGNTDRLIRVTGYMATQNVTAVSSLPSGTQ